MKLSIQEGCEVSDLYNQMVESLKRWLSCNSSNKNACFVLFGTSMLMTRVFDSDLTICRSAKLIDRSYLSAEMHAFVLEQIKKFFRKKTYID